MTLNSSRSIWSSGCLALFLATAPLRLFAQDNSQGDVFGAIAINDVEQVRAFLKEDPACVSRPTSKGITPLHYAAQRNCAGVISILVDSGANINATIAGSQTTPLHWAANSGSAESVRLLLQKGAKVNAIAKNGFTALHFAAKNNNAESIDALLKAGADINALDRDFSTPLHIAAKANATDAVRALLQANAKTGLLDNKGHSAFDLAKDEARELLNPERPPESQPPQTLAQSAGEPAKSIPPKTATDAPVKTSPAPSDHSTVTEDNIKTVLAILQDKSLSVTDRYAKLVSLPFILSLPDGSFYFGKTTIAGKPSGFGILLVGEQGREYYVGHFARGKKEGAGTYYYANGDTLECSWEENAPDGNGVFTFADGNKIQGSWEKGIFRDGNGTYNGTGNKRFFGVWKSGFLVDTRAL